MTDYLAKIVYYRSFCHIREGTCHLSPHLTGPVFYLFLYQYGELNHWIDVSGKVTEDDMGNSWLLLGSLLILMYHHRQMGCLSNRNEGRAVYTSQHCYCWNYCQKRMCNYLHLLKCCRETFFSFCHFQAFLNKSLPFKFNWEGSKDSLPYTVGGLKRLCNSPECCIMAG